jgi:hypothetical protein
MSFIAEVIALDPADVSVNFVDSDESKPNAETSISIMLSASATQLLKLDFPLGSIPE